MRFAGFLSSTTELTGWTDFLPNALNLVFTATVFLIGFMTARTAVRRSGAENIAQQTEAHLENLEMQRAQLVREQEILRQQRSQGAPPGYSAWASLAADPVAVQINKEIRTASRQRDRQLFITARRLSDLVIPNAIDRLIFTAVFLLTLATISGVLATGSLQNLVTTHAAWPFLKFSAPLWPQSGSVLAIVVAVAVTLFVGLREARYNRLKGLNDLVQSPSLITACLIHRAHQFTPAIEKTSTVWKAADSDDCPLYSRKKFHLGKSTEENILTIKSARILAGDFSSDNEFILKSLFSIRIEEAAVQTFIAESARSTAELSYLAIMAGQIIDYEDVLNLGQKTLLSIGARTIQVATQPGRSGDPSIDSQLLGNAVRCVEDRPADFWNIASAATWWLRRATGMRPGNLRFVEDQSCAVQAANLFATREEPGEITVRVDPAREIATIAVAAFALGGHHLRSIELADQILALTWPSKYEKLKINSRTARMNKQLPLLMEATSLDTRMAVARAAKIHSQLRLGMDPSSTVSDLFSDADEIAPEQIPGQVETLLIEAASQLPSTLLQQFNDTRIRPDLRRIDSSHDLSKIYKRISRIAR